ncbi:MAG: TonB family protein [Vicinamibacterales bacterium]
MSTPQHISRFVVVQPIAAGGMGEVLLARDERLDRLVAIKLLREGFDTEDLRLRFEEEARNVARLTHPNIVTIYEYGTHEQRPYIAMEYVAGHSMADLVKRRVPLPLARRVRLIEEVCSGLAHAHKAQLVHRDVKPANLMVTTSGMVKVLDFGIAKMRGTDRTQKGMIVGTVNYMSPEQITGQAVDHRSDVFAVGAVLHELLTYDQAFKGDLTTAMFNIVHGQPEPLATHCPGLDPAFQAVVNKCLAKAPADRYQDLLQLKRDLARLRRPLEDEDAEPAETIVPLDVEKTMVVPAAPASDAQPRVAGPDTRRALGAALASGEAAMAGGQFDSAMRFAEQALALESVNVSAQDLLDRARAARERARLDSKLGRAREALAADRLDDARHALEEAATLAPGSSTVRTLVSNVDARAADLERLERTVVLAREQLDALNFDKARELAQTAVLIRPEHSGVQRLQAEIDRAEEEAREQQAAARAAEEQREKEAAARREAEAAAAREAEARREAEEQQRREAAEARAKEEAARREAEAAQRRAEAEARAREEAARREAEAKRREEERLQREAEAREREAKARAARIADLRARAQRKDAAPAARRDAVTELASLSPDEPGLAALKSEIDAAVAEAARQKALDDALTDGERQLAGEQFDAAAARAAEVTAARPGDRRAAALTTAIAEGRRRQQARMQALAAATAHLEAGRFAEAAQALAPADPSHADVAALSTRIQEAERAEARRQRMAALSASLRGLAGNRAVQAGAGLAAAGVLAVWLWPARSSTSTDAPPAETPGVTTPVADGPADNPAPRQGNLTPSPESAGGTSAPGEPVSPLPSTGPGGPGGPVAPVNDSRPPAPDPRAPRPDGTAVTPVRVGGAVNAPRKLQHVEPTYPAAALSARVQGTVTAEIQVGTDGTVRESRVVRSVPGLDQAALEAVRQWRYAPPIVNGTPTPVLLTVTVVFRLPEATPPAPTPGATATRNESERTPVPPAPTDTRPATPAEEPPAADPKPEPAPFRPRPSDGDNSILAKADETVIRGLVARFGQAYQERDVDELKRVWPSMPRNVESSYRNVFQSYSRLGWRLQGVDVSMDGDEAEADVRTSVELRELRSNVATTEGRTHHFRFARRATGWAIVGVENRR